LSAAEDLKVPPKIARVDGIAARARGKRPGRQPLDIDKVHAALKLVEAGLSPTKAASQLGLGRSTVYREVAAAGVTRKAS